MQPTVPAAVCPSCYPKLVLCHRLDITVDEGRRGMLDIGNSQRGLFGYPAICLLRSAKSRVRLCGSRFNAPGWGIFSPSRPIHFLHLVGNICQVGLSTSCGLQICADRRVNLGNDASIACNQVGVEKAV
jgi:hypothetical protein